MSDASNLVGAGLGQAWVVSGTEIHEVARVSVADDGSGYWCRMATGKGGLFLKRSHDLYKTRELAQAAIDSGDAAAKLRWLTTQAH